MDKKRTNRTRSSKYLPVNILPLTIGEERLTIYFWDNNPVQLWAWGLPGKRQRTWELHGLEKCPSPEQLEPAFAYLALMRETDRREKGKLSHGGRKPDPEWGKLILEWKQSGFDPKVKRQLWETSGKKYEWETFDRTMKRGKSKNKG